MLDWLQDILSGSLRSILIGMVVLFGTVSLAKWIGSKTLKSQSGGSGRMGPSVSAIYGIGLVAILLLVFFTYALINVRDPVGIVVLSALIVCGILTLLCLVQYMTPANDIIWDEAGFEGPKRRFQLSLQLDRGRILWRHVVQTGTTQSGYFFAEGIDGTRIYWSYLYSGHADFHEHLFRKCRQLK